MMEPDGRTTDSADPTDPTIQESIRRLDALLRGEIAAAETYRTAIDGEAKSGDAPQAKVLRDMQEEHGRAAQSLRNRITELGGEPSDTSGAWGAWAKVVQEIMGLFGSKGRFKALREGETHGLKEYEDAPDHVDPISAQLIRDKLIPAQQRHLNLLDQLLETGKLT